MKYNDICINSSLERNRISKLFIIGLIGGIDCGCGTAPMLMLLHQKYLDKHYTGIDLTHKMIGVAKRKNMKGVELVVGDCENLSFAENSFDVV